MNHETYTPGHTITAVEFMARRNPSAQLLAGYLALQLENKGEAAHSKSLPLWGQHPEAMFAQAWFEAVGRRE